MDDNGRTNGEKTVEKEKMESGRGWEKALGRRQWWVTRREGW